MNDYYYVIVEYPFGSSTDRSYDTKIRGAAAKQESSSGYFYLDDTANVQFCYKTKKSAFAAAARIRAKCRKQGLRAYVMANEE